MPAVCCPRFECSTPSVPQPEKPEVRTKRKYEKRPKAAPLAPAASLQASHSGLLSFNAKDLNQYDFPSSDDEPFAQVGPPASASAPVSPVIRSAFRSALTSNPQPRDPLFILQMLSGSSETEEENDPDGAFSFRRKAGCQYYSVSVPSAPASSPALTRDPMTAHPRPLQARVERSGSWAWCSPADGGLGDARFRYSLAALTAPHRCVGLARRRFGRGGRWGPLNFAAGMTVLMGGGGGFKPCRFVSWKGMMGMKMNVSSEIHLVN